MTSSTLSSKDLMRHRRLSSFIGLFSLHFSLLYCSNYYTFTYLFRQQNFNGFSPPHCYRVEVCELYWTSMCCDLSTDVTVSLFYSLFRVGLHWNWLVWLDSATEHIYFPLCFIAQTWLELSSPVWFTACTTWIRFTLPWLWCSLLFYPVIFVILKMN